MNTILERPIRLNIPSVVPATLLFFIDSLAKNFLTGIRYVSRLNIEESLVDFQVRNTPIGSSTIEDIKAPSSGDMAPSLASLRPDVSTTQYNTKKSAETMTGVPSPPLRMMAPRGAPMKKNIKHANERVNFRSDSRSIRRR